MSTDISATKATPAEERAIRVAFAEEDLDGMFTDLTAVDTKPREWVPGCDGMWHRGSRGYLFAARGEGKSLAMTIQAAQVVEAGGTVVYIDLENGRRRMGERLQAILGDRPAEVKVACSERLHYTDQLRFPMFVGGQHGDEYLEALTNILGTADIVYVDSWARALAQEGLDEDKSSQVTRWLGNHVDRWVSANPELAVIILDNTGHANKRRGRGASGKEDLLEVCYKVSGGKHCSPTKHGRITLERTRSRDGDEVEELSVEAGDERYGRIEACEPTESAKVTERRAAFVEFFKEHPTEEFASKPLEDHFKMARNTVRKYMDELVAEGIIEYTSTNPNRWRKLAR